MTDRLAVSVKDAATLVGVSADTIRAEINALRLPAKRNGTRLLVRVSDLGKWLDSLEDAAS